VRPASDSGIRLLLIVLDRVFVPNPGLAGIQAELAQGAPLVEEVLALIELDRDL
jgi:hypothetical protein